MGNEGNVAPDEVRNIYCFRCGKITEHNIYYKFTERTRQETIYMEYCQITRPAGSEKYKTTKQVCTVCGRTKTKTRSQNECCKIF